MLISRSSVVLSWLKSICKTVVNSIRLCFSYVQASVSRKRKRCPAYNRISYSFRLYFFHQHIFRPCIFFFYFCDNHNLIILHNEGKNGLPMSVIVVGVYIDVDETTEGKSSLCICSMYICCLLKVLFKGVWCSHSSCAVFNCSLEQLELGDLERLAI